MAATQAVTFGLVLAMPTPSANVSKVAAIVAALRSGKPDGSLKVTTRSSALNDNWQDPTETTLSRRIAHELGVSTGRVKVVLLREVRTEEPEGHGSRPEASARPPSFDRGPPGDEPIASTGNSISAPFEAALRLADGHWRIVSSPIPAIEKWQWEVLLWLLGSAIVVAPFAWFFARQIAEPIAAFGRAADRLGADPRSEPVDVRGPPEITAAAAAINQMHERLRRYVDERLLMVGSMAHDLRTPLMRLALIFQETPEAIRTAGEAEIREIDQMAADVLCLVRDHSHVPERQQLALRSLVETVVEEAADLGRNVRLKPGADVDARVDVAGIRRLLANVIDNAVAYGDEAIVELTATSEAAIITVCDRGPGLAYGDFERVFEPFYRAEPSRSRRTGGVGLGLASARAVAQAHGGTIVLANLEAGGLMACVTIPLQPERRDQ